jgi:hypothetical protein
MACSTLAEGQALYVISALACQKIKGIFKIHVGGERNFLATPQKNSLNHIGGEKKERSGERKSRITLGMDYLWDLLDQSICKLLGSPGLCCYSSGND